MFKPGDEKYKYFSLLFNCVNGILFTSLLFLQLNEWNQTQLLKHYSIVSRIVIGQFDWALCFALPCFVLFPWLYTKLPTTAKQMLQLPISY